MRGIALGMVTKPVRSVRFQVISVDTSGQRRLRTSSCRFKMAEAFAAIEFLQSHDTKAAPGLDPGAFAWRDPTTSRGLFRYSQGVEAWLTSRSSRCCLYAAFFCQTQMQNATKIIRYHSNFPTSECNEMEYIRRSWHLRWQIFARIWP